MLLLDVVHDAPPDRLVRVVIGASLPDPVDVDQPAEYVQRYVVLNTVFELY